MEPLPALPAPHRAVLPTFRRAALALGFAAAGLLAVPAGAARPIPDLPTDRIVVRLKAGAPTQLKSAADREGIATRMSARSGELMRPHHAMSEDVQVMQLFRLLRIQDIEALARRFEGDADILEILPDRIVHTALTPNDPRYVANEQWSLSAATGVNAPAAWDITTGIAGLTIGIIDTGRLNHTELASRWIGGYDFVSLSERENDGDPGRDTNPADPGDWVTAGEAASGPLLGCTVTNSRWHGTAMAGAIGATGDNGIGIAGLNWVSKLLPVRAVGKCGGYSTDVIAAMRWAAGIPVSGAPVNANPADVLNVSLTSTGACDSLWQSAINEITNLGVPIVVAAGNQNDSLASGYTPASCANVITVGAVDRVGGRPPYANRGSPIAISAPGGVGSTTTNAIVTTFDGDGVTTGLTTPVNDSSYLAVNGTSIATAHVTGIVSLMLSVKPTLSPAQVKDILRNTSRAFPAVGTGLGGFTCTQADCGLGIVNAHAAVQAAQNFGNATPMVAAGTLGSFALRSDGALFSWGHNGSGLLLDGTTNARSYPGTVAVPNVAHVSANDLHALVAKADGTVWGAGMNTNGQLGDNSVSPNPVATPVQAQGLTTVVEVSAGMYHSLARRSDGSVWGWGRNTNGQVGNGTTADQYVPVQVTGLTGTAVSIATAESTSVAAKSDGTVWCWGDCSGLGGSSSQATPVQVPGLTQITQVSGTRGPGIHFLGRRSDSTARAWGSNEYGQIGNGTTSPTRVFPPVVVSGLTGVVAVAAGYRHSLALKDDGRVYGWGSNANGQLGLGNSPSDPSALLRTLPALVPGLTGVSGIAAGSLHSLALKPDGSVFAWGYQSSGQLGNGSTTALAQTSAIQVSGTGGVGELNVGAASSFSFASQTDVPVSSVRTSNAIPVTGIDNGSVISVSAGASYSVGCTASFATDPGTINDGQTVCVRQTSSASFDTTTVATLTIAGLARTFTVTTRVADTSPNPYFFPPQGGAVAGSTVTSAAATITGIEGPAPVSIAGGTYSVGCGGSYVSTAGSVTNGQTVCLRVVASNTPGASAAATLTIGGVSATFTVFTAPAAGYNGTPMVAAGTLSSFGLRSDGTLFGWGYNGSGTLLDGTNAGRSLPAAVTAITGIVHVSGNDLHTLVARTDGTVWGSGSNTQGQLGDGTFSATPILSPVQAQGLTGVVEVSAGMYHSLARKSDLTVWGWGRNTNGQVGNGSTADQYVPVQVSGLTNVISIATAESTSVAAKQDGSVWCWGDCSGIGGSSNQSTPAQVAGLSTITQVSGTRGPGLHFLARRTGGTAWAWGSNEYGQIGNGTTSPTRVYPPVLVSGLSNVSAVAAGYRHSLALKTDGSVWGWGSNANGQLGLGNNPTDPSALQRTLPSLVVGLTGVSGIAAGSLHSLALKPDGSVAAWGYQSSGQLGNNNPVAAAQTSAVQVLDPPGTAFLNLGVADPTVFAPQTDVPVSSVRTSNAIVVTGISDGSAISISGSGSYSIGCTASFVTAPGTINNNQSVCVRQTSPASYATTQVVTLTIAATPRTFSVTTRTADATPNPFAFAPRGGAAPGAAVDSAPATIGGTEAPVAISVSGGSYCISSAADCACNVLAFTTGASTIAPGQSACVRVTASNTPGASAAATLTVGGVSATFTAFTAVASNYVGTPMVAAGTLSSFGLRSDGTLFGWGYNGAGTLLDGTNSQRALPGLVAMVTGIVHVSGNDLHTLIARTDGTVWGSGSNTNGQLGDGTFSANPILSPVQAQGLTGVVEVSAGMYHSLARKSDGTVWGWGRNANGQVGNGSTADQYVPVQVASLSGIVVSIATAESTSVAAKSDGTVWCWGDCSGIGGSSNQSTPVQVAGLTTITQVSGTRGPGLHFLARRTGGTAWAWGSNEYGQIGNGTTSPTRVYPPVLVSGLSNVSAVAAGYRHSMALKVDGTVSSWGSNASGQLGLGNNPTDPSALLRTLPSAVPGLTGASGIAAGSQHSMAFKPDGSTYAWGNQSVGQLGNNVVVNVAQTLPIQTLGLQGDGFLSLNLVNTYPAPFAFLPRFSVGQSELVVSNSAHIDGISAPTAPISVTGGEYCISSVEGCSCDVQAFTSTAGNIANNRYVCLRVTAANTEETTVAATLLVGGAGGRSSTFYVRTRRNATTAAPVPRIAMGQHHTLVLNSDGTVYGFGYNGNGQLGNGTTLSTAKAVPVAGLSGIRSISSGGFHGLAARSDGTVLSWGWNAGGQLGNGVDENSRLYFTTVTGITGATQVAAGEHHSLALRNDGTVMAWGLNVDGQLGNVAAGNRQNTPIVVTGLAGIVAIAAGARHSLAIDANGELWAWGSNEFGQLGDGTTTNRGTPVKIASFPGVLAIAGGSGHSLALKSDGSLFAWGNNAQGQLGNGSTTNALTPVAVSGMASGVARISAGGNHSAAIKVGGTLYAWGSNSNGQIGDGTSNNRTTPFNISAQPGAPVDVVAIASGQRHSAALQVNGELYLWGDNFFGQVGNKSGNYNPQSASLNVLRGDSGISEGADGEPTSGGPPSAQGKGVLLLDGLATGYGFTETVVGTEVTAPGKFKNESSEGTIGSISFATSGPGFGVTTNCPSSLGPGLECAFTLSFNPPLAGTLYGQLIVTTDMEIPTITRDLTGIGIPPAVPALSLPEPVVLFVSRDVGSASSPQPVTVNNPGTATLAVSTVTSNLGDFVAGHNCGAVIAGGTCTVSVTFTPSQPGTRTAILTINSNAGSVPMTVMGDGVASLNDTTPDAFSFVPQAGVASGSVRTSNAVTITGINAPAAISVTGGTFSIGCNGTFGSGATTITNGQTVCVRHTASLAGAALTTTTLTVGGVSAGFTSTTAVSVDFNLDAKSDLLWKHTDGRYAVWLMNGLGPSATSEILAGGTGFTVAHIADFDGDGKADLLWSHADGRVAIWLMNGSAPTATAQILNAGGGWTAVHTGDLDGDGKADIVWQHTDGSVAVWLMNGSVPSGTSGILGASTGWSVAHLGDFDGDGRKDLYWQHTDGRAAIWLMNGLAPTATNQILNAASGWSAAHVADISGDGKADIVWQHTDGSVAVWLMNGAVMASGSGILGPASGWSVARTADFDGDGKRDLYWQHGDGRAAIWLMNGLVPSATAQILNAGGGWSLRRTADLNGDGKADIVWIHTDGSVAAWLMNGAAMASGSGILGPSSGWSISNASP